jgi:hypothetical protein
MIERYSFIPVSAWESVKSVFPNAISYGNSKVVQYASPVDSTAMLELVNKSGLEFIHHSLTDAQMIIDAIESGIDKVYNCNIDVARDVASHFGGVEQ